MSSAAQILRRSQIVRTKVLTASLLLIVVTSFSTVAVGQNPLPEDKSLLNARRLVWTAYFNNDERALKELLPDDLVAGDGSKPSWETRDEILRDASDFAAHHGKLKTLNFTNVRIQHFSETAIIYSDYSLTGEWSGKPFKQSGKSMEVFVFHEGRWTNAGWQLG
jgi:hypothetical protein